MGAADDGADVAGGGDSPRDILDLVIAHAPVVLFATDADGVITLARGQALEALGLPAIELVGQSLFDLVHDEPAIAEPAHRALAGELVVTRIELGALVHEARFQPQFDADGRVTGILCIAVDVTERERAEGALARRAYVDDVTGLPSRLSMEETIDAAIRQEAPRPFTLLSIGIDRFSDLNGSHGFDFGDEVLRAMGARLRNTYPPPSAVARLGGDQFLVLLNEPGADLDAALSRLTAALAEPLAIADEPVTVDCTTGVALYPSDGDSAQLLLRHADAASREAKRAGLSFNVYRAGRDEPTNQLQLLHALRDGIERGELELHYQPQIHIADRRILAYEALVRWQRRGHGLLPPAAFLPVAERTNVIHHLDAWVINEAARQVMTWRRAGFDFPVMVNISTRSFQDRRLPHALADAMSQWGVDGEHLGVEITETAMMFDPDRAASIAAEIHDLGVTIAIDDFGTGFSPLLYVQQLGADAIKIDGSFIRDMLTSEHSESIVRTVVDLGKRLDMHVIAEGVEGEAAYAHLAAIGCEQVQGFFIARPMPPDAIPQWLSTTHWR